PAPGQAIAGRGTWLSLLSCPDVASAGAGWARRIDLAVHRILNAPSGAWAQQRKSPERDSCRALPLLPRLLPHAFGPGRTTLAKRLAIHINARPRSMFHCGGLYSASEVRII